MTRKKPGYYAALVFENCHSKERSSDLGRFRWLATVRCGLGCEISPILRPGFIELPVVFTPSSAGEHTEIKSRAESHDGTQACSPSPSPLDKGKATRSPPWLFRGVRVER